MSGDDIRTAVVETARTMLRLGLASGTSGNVSARDGDAILITPAALGYEEMTEGDLVTLSPGGEVVAGEREPSSERRVHVAIYGARPDALAVVHTHSEQATAWSFVGEPLETGTDELEAATGGVVATTQYAATGTDEIADACVEALGARRAVLLARHGVVAVGATPAAALETAIAVERQAQVAWLVRGTHEGGR